MSNEAGREDFALLFHYNPPRPPRFLQDWPGMDDQDRTEAARRRQRIRDLFIDRDPQLKWMKGRFPPSQSTNQINAVHGASRVGKSHLVFRFLQEDELDDWHVIWLNAEGQFTARLVIEFLFNELHAVLQLIDRPLELVTEEVSSAGILGEVKRVAATIARRISSPEGEVSHTIARGREQSAGGEAAITSLVKVIGSVKESSDESVTYALTPPSDEQIVEIIAEIIDCLRLATRKQTIVYVDDVDLLEVGTDHGREHADRLKRLLWLLADHPSGNVHVLTSVRTRNMGTGQKALVPVVEVEPFHDNSDLRSIYDLRVQRYHAGEPVFADDCVSKIIEMASGKPGNLLRICHDFHEWCFMRGHMDGSVPPGLDALRSFVRDRIEKMRGNSVACSGYLAEIEKAVRDGDIEVSLGSGVLATDLVYLVLVEPPTLEPTDYAIQPYTLEVMTEMLGADTPDADA